MRDKLANAMGTLTKHRITLLVLVLFLVLAFAMRTRDQEDAEGFTGVVEREDETGSAASQSFSFHLEEGEMADAVGEQEIDLEVSPLQLEREEAFALLDAAVTEWEETYLGENTSGNEIRKDLVLPSSLCDGMVEISYETSDYDVVNTDGTVTTYALTAEGELVDLTAHFSYGDYTQIEEYTLRILPPEEGSADWVVRELTREAEQTEEDSREQETFSLPDTVGGYRVIWEQGEDNSWIYFILLGALAAFCLEWRGKSQEKERRKKRAARLELEYPRMVDQFAVLLESGMSIRKAWERILVGGGRAAQAGGRKKQETDVYLEEMWITYREIREGRGEREAYERFGDRIGLMPYKRFSSILTQNLSKGTRDVKELLQQESEQALEDRKSRARKLGEEAGAKMLFPMLVMLVLILVILLVPALTNL